MQKIQVCYYVVNGGDGSAYPTFFPTLAEAEAAEEKEIEECGEGWAEPSVGTLDLYVEKGVYYLRTFKYEWDASTKTLQNKRYEYVELPFPIEVQKEYFE